MGGAGSTWSCGGDASLATRTAGSKASMTGVRVTSGRSGVRDHALAVSIAPFQLIQALLPLDHVEVAHQHLVSQTLITMETPSVAVPTIHHSIVHSHAVCCHDDGAARRQSHRPDPAGGVCAPLFVLRLMRLVSIGWLSSSGAGPGTNGWQSSCSGRRPFVKPPVWVQT